MKVTALLLLAACLVAAAAGSAAPSTAGRPALRLVPAQTVVVRGSGFRPSERVRLSGQTREGAVRKTVKANASGGFVARWALPAEYCTGVFLVRATDSRGRTVSLRVARVTQDCAPVAP
jgi:hypothetical protein